MDYAIEVSPKGIVTDADPQGRRRVRLLVELGRRTSRPSSTGRLNKSTDMDEEWVIEMALPFESIGLKGESGESIGLSLKRCDTPKKSDRVCAGWEGRLVLE